MHKTKQKIEWKRFGIHLLFWVVSLGFFWVLFSRNTNSLFHTSVFLSILSPVAIFTTYFFNYRLIPKFLIKGDYFRFGWYGAATAIVAVWVSLLGGVLIWIWLAEFNMGQINYSTVDVPMLVAALFFVVFMGIAAKLIRLNLQIQYQKENAEKERLLLDHQLKVNELKMLKDQLNPHFLFNTLNNLYGLTLEKSDEAPDLVMRLSNMLDYMLYRTNNSNVPLEQEAQMIRNYVTIEQYRYDGRYPIRFDIEGNLNNLKIAPLLLLPLAENCFKHGLQKSVEDSFMEMKLKVTSKTISFTTRNPLSESLPAEQGGIGLTNLRRRLEMIYPASFDLFIDAGESIFTTQLTIYLK